MKCYKKDISFSESQGETESIKELYRRRFKVRTLKGIEDIKNSISIIDECSIKRSEHYTN
ncbi:hypothetical protein DB313_05965 (plasmid) [Borrelia turcica IST7]|uniref:Uncharacterized protein n=1 Tax=Borrelia turcica IST7 TaxID=1104446 RepID=A0A386PR52_9SPIR|nr:hypothetical protein DB313_05965 [Borrelia turcica IST7]